MSVEPVHSGVARPLAGPLAAWWLWMAKQLGRLLDENGDYLTDELGNRLTG